MKPLCLILPLYLLPILVFSQSFTFDLYFEDITGQKDTITLGYDLEATIGIDSQFGEENIKDIPFDSTFEVRACNISTSSICDMPLPVPDFTTFHTKKQIVNDTCYFGFQQAIGIIFHKADFPIKAHWDSEMFQDICRSGSLITGWQPGGWFDATCAPHYIHYFAEKDSAILERPEFSIMITPQDTVDLLFAGFVPDDVVSTSTVDIPESIVIMPNPANAHFQVVYKQASDGPIETRILNVNGELLEHLKVRNQQVVSTDRFAPGLYFVQLFRNGTFLQTEKLIISK